MHSVLLNTQMITSKKISLNRPYYLVSDMTNIKNFNPNFLSTNKISYKILTLLSTTLDIS